MPIEIASALLALIGTCVGSLSGILVANRLTNYRIGELEKKVDKHNSLIERTAVLERDMKAAFGRIDENRNEIRRDHT